MLEFLKSIFSNAWILLMGASTWLMISFLLVGLLRDTLSPMRFQRTMGNKKFSSLLKGLLTSLLLPICNCGTLPIGMTMYYSGVYLGPVMTFMTSSPIINPLAVILALGLLGKEVTMIYVIGGIIISLILGVLANLFSGKELFIEGMDASKIPALEENKGSLINRLKSGLYWSFNDLAGIVIKYTVFGMLLVGFIMTIVSDDWIEYYLGNPEIISVLIAAVLSLFMYICSVGFIPFVAALMVGGASPGVAITFLIVGQATNIPQIISLRNAIGNRAMIFYSVLYSLGGILLGFITNLLLLPGFKPVIQYDKGQEAIGRVGFLFDWIPEWLKVIFTLIILGIFTKTMIPEIRKRFQEMKERE